VYTPNTPKSAHDEALTSVSLTSQVLYNFQSVYITVYRHKQPFYIAFIKYFEVMKCASMGRKSSDIDTHVAIFLPIRAGVIS
jgi:hypothetical protein